MTIASAKNKVGWHASVELQHLRCDKYSRNNLRCLLVQSLHLFRLHTTQLQVDNPVDLVCLPSTTASPTLPRHTRGARNRHT